MNKQTTALALLAIIITACAPRGGSGGRPVEVHTGWQGLPSAGPASPDGAVSCGVPSREAFTCADGASVRAAEHWVACVRPGQVDIGGNGAQAAGDFVLLDLSGRVVVIGTSDGATLTRAWCVRDSEPVPSGWLGQRVEVRAGFPVVDEVCWIPDTGAAAACESLGWSNGRPMR